jgi:hypothetical protein
MLSGVPTTSIVPLSLSMSKATSFGLPEESTESFWSCTVVPFAAGPPAYVTGGGSTYQVLSSMVIVRATGSKLPPETVLPMGTGVMNRTSMTNAMMRPAAMNP